jgi:hypothetical protein
MSSGDALSDRGRYKFAARHHSKYGYQDHGDLPPQTICIFSWESLIKRKNSTHNFWPDCPKDNLWNTKKDKPG